MKKRLQILIAIGILTVGFFCLDCALGRKQYSECSVFGRDHQAALDEIYSYTDSDGHTQISTTHHSERWICVVFEQMPFKEGKVYDVDVGWETFNVLTNGMQITVCGRRGKWTGHKYFAKVEL